MPTRKRPGRFLECLAAIEKTKTGEVEVLTYVDADDNSGYRHKSIVGKAKGNAERFKALIAIAKHDFFLIIGDDQIPITKGWDEKMKAMMPKDCIGLVHCKDNWKEQISAILVHRKWYELTGLYPDEFEHFGLDTYMGDLARELKRLFRTEEVIIEHRNHRNPRAKVDNDETYMNPRQNGSSSRDFQKLQELRKHRMPEDLKTLRNYIQAEIERHPSGA